MNLTNSYMKFFLSAVVGTMLLVSCSKAPSGWIVDGQVDGGVDYRLTLEGHNNGRWYVIDTLYVTNGTFRYEAGKTANYAEIMRLGHGGEYIYFPIDSDDRISIKAKADNFNTNYSIEGSADAQTIKTIDSLINVSLAERGIAETLNDTSFKYGLFVKAYEAPTIMPLYYLINKSIGDNMMFDINKNSDIRYFGAVAQRFNTERPDDQRGQILSDLYTRARAQKSGNTKTIEVSEASIIDIKRADVNGKYHSLADATSKGNVVLLSMTAYGLEISPAYNVILNSAYEKYRDRGLDIFQVAFDSDETFWKETVRNLPWTAVWNSTTDGNSILASYNINRLPTTFIIDRSGTIVAKIEDPSELMAKIEQFI